MSNMLYVSSLYDQEAPSDYIKAGYYGYDRCGGCCHWVITESKTDADNWCIPYDNTKYLYLFSFYDDKDIQNELLYKLLTNISKVCKVNVIKGNEREYILLSNDLILYETSNRSESVAPSDIKIEYQDILYPENFDDLGGSIEYIDFSLVNPDLEPDIEKSDS